MIFADFRKPLFAEETADEEVYFFYGTHKAFCSTRTSAIVVHHESMNDSTNAVGATAWLFGLTGFDSVEMDFFTLALGVSVPKNCLPNKGDNDEGDNVEEPYPDDTNLPLQIDSLGVENKPGSLEANVTLEKLKSHVATEQDGNNTINYLFTRKPLFVKATGEEPNDHYTYYGTFKTFCSTIKSAVVVHHEGMNNSTNAIGATAW
ncbi:hypothetical protein MRX96_017566, partial [Rhipicephalus microplus]